MKYTEDTLQFWTSPLSNTEAMLHSPAKNSMQLSAFAVFYSRVGTVRSQSAAIPHKSWLFQNFSYPSPTAPVQ